MAVAGTILQYSPIRNKQKVIQGMLLDKKKSANGLGQINDFKKWFQFFDSTILAKPSPNLFGPVSS